MSEITTDAERAARQAHLQQAEADFDPLPLIPTPHGLLVRAAASLRYAGRKVNAGLPVIYLQSE